MTATKRVGGDSNVKEFKELSEIFDHNTKESCWLLIEGKVYDVTNFKHPGGKQILLQNAGQDATTQFEDIGHSQKAHDDMKKLLIGTFDMGDDGAQGLDKKPSDETNPMVNAFLVLLFILTLGFLYTQITK